MPHTIRQIVAYPLRAVLQEPFAYSQRWFGARSALLVEVVTEDGLTGWGEVFCHDGWPAVVALLEQVYQPLLIGEDALAREVIWEKLYNWTRDYGQKGLTTAALSGINIALWDIAGKVADQPIYRLLGGPFRTEVQAYATGLYLTEAAMDDPAALADEAMEYVDQGFKAVKMKVGFGIDQDVRAVQRVRRTIGDEIGLMVDANHAYDATSAISLGRRLEACDLGWFEEPVVPEDLEGYRLVRQALSIPIAGGEAEFTRYGFRELITRGCVDIAQPDLCITGGISETLRIAYMAQTWGVRCVPHVWGTGVALAAALHTLAALPHHPGSLNPLPPLLEYDRTENPLREELLVTPHVFHEGVMRVPDGPGLGVEIDRQKIERYRVR
jgi:D-galactarolactone cycloisomerase